ncbi:MAG: alanine racemase [Candidatus Eremiobacteraeota bacterium]|nr:alanine racemase [Candidatus Eremiobacteraeota bacterium]
MGKGTLRTNGVKSVAWIEVDLDAIRDNFLTVRSIVGRDTKICAVVKADAYGHGVCEVAKTLAGMGADYFAVAILDEAIELRKMGIDKPILVLGPLMPGQASYVMRYNITQTICSLEMAEELSREAFRCRKPVKIHIKVDTGMGRLGVYYEDAVALTGKIKDLPYIDIEGIFTHYATADNANKDYVNEQWSNFSQVLEDLKNSGINIPIAHAATSSTIIDNPEMKLDMVRPGLMLYGLYPRSTQREMISLKPALTYKAKISFLKDIAKRRSISYGRKYFATVGEKIATLPLGYNDGIRRILTGKGEVLIRGKRCPMVGTICMDHIMANVTDLNEVKRFDEVVLIGRQGDNEIPIDELASKSNTINYEITSCLGRRVPRIYLSEGRRVAVRNLLGYLSDTILPYESKKDDVFCLNGSSLQ